MSFGKIFCEDENLITIDPPSSLNPPCLKSLEKEDLKKYFLNTWALNEWLFSGITGSDAFYKNPDPLRHPLIFYWGHTAAFYINKMVRVGLLPRGIDTWFEELFEQGVDPKRPQDLVSRKDWPGLSEVDRYRSKVFETILNVIEDLEIKEPINDRHPLWALMMGMEHERIHFETSSVLIRQYGLEEVTRPQDWHYAPHRGETPNNPFIAMDRGAVILGKIQTQPSSAGTMNSVDAKSWFPHLRPVNTSSPTASICSLWKKAATGIGVFGATKDGHGEKPSTAIILTFGKIKTAPLFIAPCLITWTYLLTGRWK